MFLGIDIGTTNTKALLMTGNFQVVAEQALSYLILFILQRIRLSKIHWTGGMHYAIF